MHAAVGSELLQALRDALGGERVSTDAARLGEASVDKYWKALHAANAGDPLGTAAVVVEPETEEEVAAVVRLANEHRVPVVPRGGGSGTQGGAVPVAGGIVLDLTRLDRIVEIDEESLTATVEAGHNGRELERHLNERGLMFPHYPAAAEWATVGGYVAARGSGVLSTRYGKIEDLVLSLRFVSPTGELCNTIEVPRHSVGPDLTQLLVGSEGTLGVITRAKLQLERLPEARLFSAVRFDSVADGVQAFRDTLQAGHRPSVIRLYDEVATATSLAPVVGEELDGVCALVVCEGPRPAAETTRDAVLALAARYGGNGLPGDLTETWWKRRYDFYHPPHHPELPAIWGTLEFVVPYDRVLGAYDALRASVAPHEERGLVLKIHLSHWYHWGTMLYGRFVVADGGPDAVELHDAVWRDAVAAGLGAGAVMNDHHGVGLKLAPFMREQYGPSFELLRRIKRALDPNDVMNPGKLGL